MSQFMSLVFDIILIAIAAICVIGGARRGFFKSVMSFVSGIAALLLSYAFTPSLAPVISEKFILPSLSSGIGSTLESIAENGVNTAGEAIYDLTKLAENEQFLTVAERYGADRGSLSSLIDQIGVGTKAAVDKVAEAVARPISDTLSNVIAFIVIFVVSIIALRIVIWLVGLLFSMPVLKGLDRTLGLVFGAVSALFFVWIFSMLCSTVITALSAAYPAAFSVDIIENSHLLKFFATYNVIGAVSSALGFLN